MTGVCQGIVGRRSKRLQPGKLMSGKSVGLHNGRGSYEEVWLQGGAGVRGTGGARIRAH